MCGPFPKRLEMLACLLTGGDGNQHENRYHYRQGDLSFATCLVKDGETSGCEQAGREAGARATARDGPADQPASNRQLATRAFPAWAAGTFGQGSSCQGPADTCGVRTRERTRSVLGKVSLANVKRVPAVASSWRWCFNAGLVLRSAVRRRGQSRGWKIKLFQFTGGNV